MYLPQKCQRSIVNDNIHAQTHPKCTQNLCNKICASTIDIAMVCDGWFCVYWQSRPYGYYIMNMGCIR